MRISDWSSDVCSSDLAERGSSSAGEAQWKQLAGAVGRGKKRRAAGSLRTRQRAHYSAVSRIGGATLKGTSDIVCALACVRIWVLIESGRVISEYIPRSEEHTSELQSLMRISYAVLCLKKKNIDE